MCENIDFAKAARLMREAVDRLYKASDILGVYDHGDVDGENTLADIAYDIEQVRGTRQGDPMTETFGFTECRALHCRGVALYMRDHAETLGLDPERAFLRV